MPGILDQSSFRVQIWTHHLGDAGAESTWWRFRNLFEDSKGATMGQSQRDTHDRPTRWFLELANPITIRTWDIKGLGTFAYDASIAKCGSECGTRIRQLWGSFPAPKAAHALLGLIWLSMNIVNQLFNSEVGLPVAGSIFAKACKGWKVIFKSTPWVPERTESPSDSLFSLSLCLPLPVSLFLSFVSRELVPTISYYLSYLLLFDNDLIIITSNSNSYGYGKEGCLSCCRWLLEGERSSLPGENAGDTPVFLFPAASAMPLTVIPCWPNMVLSYLQEFWNVKAERLNLSCRQNKIRMELFRELLQVSPCCGDGGRVTSNMVLTRNPLGSGAQCVLVRHSFLNHPDQSRSENSPCQFIVNPWRNPTSQGSGVFWHVRIFNLLEGKPQMTDLHGLHETSIFIIPSKISIFATNEKWIKRKSGYATCTTSPIQ